MPELFSSDGTIFDTTKMDIHYLVPQHKIISCGLKDQFMKHSSDLGEVTCEACLEIEMIESGVHRDEMRKEG